MRLFGLACCPQPAQHDAEALPAPAPCCWRSSLLSRQNVARGGQERVVPGVTSAGRARPAITSPGDTLCASGWDVQGWPVLLGWVLLPSSSVWAAPVKRDITHTTKTAEQCLFAACWAGLARQLSINKSSVFPLGELWFVCESQGVCIKHIFKFKSGKVIMEEIM